MYVGYERKERGKFTNVRLKRGEFNFGNTAEFKYLETLVTSTNGVNTYNIQQETR